MRKFICFAAASAFSAGLQAAEIEYVVPLTEFGAPDLQGFWSIATQTNLERADRFNGQLVISREEAMRVEAMVAAGFERSNEPSDPNRGAPTAGQNVGGYNTFWMDPGNRLAEVGGEIRTSIIVDPADGRLPYSEQGRANYAAAVQRRQRYDGPETRPLGERCMVGFGSSGGPPKLPVLYNNLSQIVQTEDHVVLMAEMNHDARIVRLGQHTPRSAACIRGWETPLVTGKAIPWWWKRPISIPSKASALRWTTGFTVHQACGWWSGSAGWRMKSFLTSSRSKTRKITASHGAASCR